MPGSRRDRDSDAAALSRGHRRSGASQWLHSGRHPHAWDGLHDRVLLNVVLGSIGATNCGLLLAGSAVMAVPFLLRS